MKRWNGWGEESVTYPLAAGARQYLQSKVPNASPQRDALLDEVLAQVPSSRLPSHELVRTDAMDRLRHARGQSFPDWLALRSGRIGAYPDGVAYPSTDEQVMACLRYAEQVQASVIVYGGGTSVAGHINPVLGQRPVLTLDMCRMEKMEHLDETSQLATFGAGASGPDIEARLGRCGYVLGHYPQSFDYSTLGGWIATRSSGQESAGYGRIEQLFAGGTVITPRGTVKLAPYPASAAGPDMRQLVLGSEGRMGVITSATVRVSRTPDVRWYQAVFFPDWDSALAAAREISQQAPGFTMMRVSTPTETETMLALAGHERLLGALDVALYLRGARKQKCLMMLGFASTRNRASTVRKAAMELARARRGVYVGQVFGNTWVASRFRAPYLRNTLWDAGYGLDTLETATTWNNVPAVLRDVEAAIEHALDDEDERVHLFSHLSHVYPTGSSLYFTYAFRLAADPEVSLVRWQKLKAAASAAIVRHNATISHQHGVGLDHASYLRDEKGELAIKCLGETLRYWDPHGLMNPHKLVATGAFGDGVA